MSVPEEPTTIGNLVRLRARSQGDAIALTFEGRVTSYAELDRHSNQVAHGLMSLGVGQGDRICHLGKNSDSYFEILFGTTKVGATVTPLNWRLAPPEIEYIVGDSQAEILFVGPEFITTARKIAKMLPRLKHIIAMEDATDGWPSFAAWRDSQPDSDLDIDVAPSDIALQLYTSGTTGRPKGAMLSHSAVLKPRAALHAAPPNASQWSKDDISLVTLPVFHMGGTYWGLMGLYAGAKNVIAREFDANQVLDFIERERISQLTLVPTAMQIIANHERAHQVDFSCLKIITYGAAPIPLEVLRASIAVFGCGFLQTYGSTETGIIVALSPEDHDPNGAPQMRSAGKALPGVEIAIIDETGRHVGPGEMGEICVRGPGNTSGYWHLPEATADAFDANGWFHTGDAGYIDDDGYIFVRDRLKNMIISGGENVYPTEVENAIYGHPKVAQVAVVGVPDPRWGEAVKAVVVRKPGEEVNAEEIIAWTRERIAGYKTPKSVDFVDALPLGATGKVLHRAIRDSYLASAETA